MALVWEKSLASGCGSSPFRVLVWLKERYPAESLLLCEVGASVGFHDRSFSPETAPRRRLASSAPKIAGVRLTRALGGPEHEERIFLSAEESRSGVPAVGFQVARAVEHRYLCEGLDDSGPHRQRRLLRAGGMAYGLRVGDEDRECIEVFRDRVWILQHRD
jgi:hypothetical protein